MKQLLSKLLLVLLASVMLGGCGVPGPPRPPSLELPQPVTDLRALRKGNHVHLMWTVPTEATDGETLRRAGNTRICRSNSPAMKECANPVGEVGPVQDTQQSAKGGTKIPASHTDNLPEEWLSDNPDAKVFYAVSVLNPNWRSAGLSNIVSVPAVHSLPPPANFRADVTANGVVLSWSGVPHAPDTPELQHVYRVYRRSAGSNADTMVGEVPLDTSAPLQLVDYSFEWEQTYSYRATVVTLIHPGGEPQIQFEGDGTPPAKIFVHDVFPPAVPSGLQAVYSGAGQRPFIDLIWAPDSDADLAGYNVYRREEGGEAIKINSDLVNAPAFRDTNVLSGHKYFYSASAVDVRGNQSAHSDEAGETVP